MCKPLKVVHGCIMQWTPDVLGFFSNFYSLWIRVFSPPLRRCIHEEAIRLFCANPQFPDVSEGCEPILRSHLLDVPFEFFVSSLCEILSFPDEDDCLFSSAYDKLFAIGKFDFEVFSTVLTSYSWSKSYLHPTKT